MFYKIDLNENGIKLSDQEIKDITFKEVNIDESKIEEFLRHNIEIIFDESQNETLLIVGQQVVNKERGRSDLVAIDSNGSIVLIEIKRDMSDIKNRTERFEMQAIRYAANFAKINSQEELVEKIFSKYINKYKNEYDLSKLTSDELGRRILKKFLEENNATKTFNKQQRIILIASSFDPQTLSSVSWLIYNKVDISCIAISPKKIEENSFFIDVIKILPPDKIEDYYIEVNDNNNGEKLSVERSIKKANLPKVQNMLEWKIIEIGDEVYLKKYEDQVAKIKNSSEVNYNDNSLRFNEWGQRITGWSAINIYEWTIHKKTQKTLDELRREYINKNIDES